MTSPRFNYADRDSGTFAFNELFFINFMEMFVHFIGFDENQHWLSEVSPILTQADSDFGVPTEI